MKEKERKGVEKKRRQKRGKSSNAGIEPVTSQFAAITTTEPLPQGLIVRTYVLCIYTNYFRF